MFSVSSLKAVENPTNRSSVGIAVFVTNPSKINDSEFTVMYNEESDVLEFILHFISINSKWQGNY